MRGVLFALGAAAGRRLLLVGGGLFGHFSFGAAFSGGRVGFSGAAAFAAVRGDGGAAARTFAAPPRGGRGGGGVLGRAGRRRGGRRGRGRRVGAAGAARRRKEAILEVQLDRGAGRRPEDDHARRGSWSSRSVGGSAWGRRARQPGTACSAPAPPAPPPRPAPRGPPARRRRPRSREARRASPTGREPAEARRTPARVRGRRRRPTAVIGAAGARPGTAADQLVDDVRDARRLVGRVVGDVAGSRRGRTRGGRRSGRLLQGLERLVDVGRGGRLEQRRGNRDRPRGGAPRAGKGPRLRRRRGRHGHTRARRQKAGLGAAPGSSRGEGARRSASIPAPVAGPSVGACGSPAPRTARALASRLAKTPDGRRTAIPPPLGCPTAATPACSSRVFSARIFSSVGWLSGVSLSNRTPMPGVTFSRAESFSRIQTTVPSPASSGCASCSVNSSLQARVDRQRLARADEDSPAAHIGGVARDELVEVGAAKLDAEVGRSARVFLGGLARWSRWGPRRRDYKSDRSLQSGDYP